MKLSADVPLAFTLMDIAHKKLLQNSAEKYMHRKYFKELMLQHSLAKATMYQEVGDIHKATEQIKQLVSLASAGSVMASDVTVFKVRSCVNSLLNYVKNLIIKGIPLQPLDDETDVATNIYENWLKIRYILKLIQKGDNNR